MRKNNYLSVLLTAVCFFSLLGRIDGQPTQTEFANYITISNGEFRDGNSVFELSGKDIAGLALYDLQGRIIYSPDLSNSPINLRNVPAGVYVLRVTGADGHEYHQKIVKK